MKILTANRLTDGEAVWFAPTVPGPRQSPSRRDRRRDKAGEARTGGDRQGRLANNEVVDVDLIDVEIVDGAIQPLGCASVIRAAGPPTASTSASRPARRYPGPPDPPASGASTEDDHVPLRRVRP
jgi:hypothetical protein